jgi:MYXO-CTERM domain-containing protein
MVKSHAIRRLRPLGALLVAATAGLAGPPWAQCPTGQFQCGSGYCVYNRQTCCDSVGHPEKYCPSGRECSPDGSGCLGDAISCAVLQVGVISSCGKEECTCEPTCTSSSSCSTGCCAPTANGSQTSYCAPSCVCQGQGTLIAYCGSTPVAQVDAGAYDSGTRRDGSSAEPNGPSADPFGKGCRVGQHRGTSPAPIPLVAIVVLGALRRRPRS